MKILNTNTFSPKRQFSLKSSLVAIPLCLAVLSCPQAFAQDMSGDSASDDDSDTTLMSESTLDELVNQVLAEEDGDDDEPDLPGKPKKPAKVHSKLATTYAAKEVLRWKINKNAFIDGYLEQAIAAQDDPYQPRGSKSAYGLSGSYSWDGFNLTGGADFKRSYKDVFGDWDGVVDKTYSLGVSRKIGLSKQWTLSPSFKQTRVLSDVAAKDLSKTAISLPLSFALNKEWTLKVLTLGYATQTYTNRVQAQTDQTMNYVTGAAYKLSEKATLDLSVNREVRTSNQSSAEYSKTTITPKFDYKISPTSSIGIALGYETHSNSKEEFSRWLIVPKFEIRIDI
jgi:hypothetical protein